MEGLDLRGKETRNLNGRAETRSGIMQEEEADRLQQGDDSDTFASCGVSLARCATPTLKLAPLKQCAVEGATNKDHDVIWVRRDDFANGCNSDVF